MMLTLTTLTTDMTMAAVFYSHRRAEVARPADSSLGV